MHKLTWGHSCSALWIWGSAWRRSRPPADTAPVWCLRWSWTCQTWPGRTLGMSWCCFHHLKGKKRNSLMGNYMKAAWDGKRRDSVIFFLRKHWEGFLLVEMTWVASGNILLSSYGNNKCLTQERERGNGAGGDAGVESIQFTWVTFTSSISYSLHNWNKTCKWDKSHRGCREIYRVNVGVYCLPPVHNSDTRVQLQFMALSAELPSSVTHMPVSLPETERTSISMCVCVSVCVSCVHSWHTK